MCIYMDKYTKINNLDLDDELFNYSSPKLAQIKAKKYLGKNAILYKSSRKNNKYMIFDPNNNKWIHFGQLNYEDYTKHKDPLRRDLYLSRATRIKGDWNDNPYSPNNLSIHILW